MKLFPLPERLGNWINGNVSGASRSQWFPKLNPHDGTVIGTVARSDASDVGEAVGSAKAVQPFWAELPGVKRGEILGAVVQIYRAHEVELASVVALETGKSPKDALAEVRGAIALGTFYAGEGQRLYGRTTTSGTPYRQAMTIREPLGVAGLIVAANTPFANVAWKVFPALICGNSAVVKAAEDTPYTAWAFAALAALGGLPSGVLNIIHGFGEEAGAPLVQHEDIDLLSFTGSTETGRIIGESAAKRLTRLSLELGGKNPFIVCDDADLELAVHWATLSAFSNAGQRCAAGSRIIVCDEIYDEFRGLLLQRTKDLSVGPTDNDDFGPVINEAQLDSLIEAIQAVSRRGGRILTGGKRLSGERHRNGFYLAPTLVENVDPNDEFSRAELFGPVAALYRAKNFQTALSLANNSPYGLTAAIHTRSIHRAQGFIRQIKSGVAVVNAGTYGSEPHMPFGGVRQSGNGSREPGTEALDFYANLKDVYIIDDPKQV